ncbi:MAG: 16S rRNA (uracil(1498)-N(3))-methyltransferase [Pseudobdellovibrionaceae bacterium]
MRRYWIPRENIQGPTVDITGEVFHHIFDVCRQELGSHFEILGDGNKAHLVEVTELGKKSARAKILESREIPALAKPNLVLALSISRYPVMDAVIEKAVEMGVSRIQLFFSDFSFIRKKNSLPPGKIERWEKIVVSATQQTGRGDLMTIAEPVDLQDLLREFNQKTAAKGLFAYEGKSTLGIKEHLRSQALNQLDEYWVFVGSEGGFSSTEVESFQAMGLQPITLGEQVLRVETACIALLAVLKYEFGHMTARS